MITELAPDYDLFVKIFFAYWVLMGIGKLLAGLVQADRPNRNTYGIIEILDGGLALLLAAWVVS